MKNINLLKKVSVKSVIFFCLTLVLCSTLVISVLVSKSNAEKLKMEKIILEESNKINEVLSNLLFKTYTLRTLVIQGGGAIPDFDRIAATIVDDPAIINILIAPGGVVSNVYPLEGNQEVLGLDFFKEGAGNKEAIMAKETKSLVVGGPFTLVQGSQAIVGRLPVFIDQPSGGSDFWGIVSVTLKYPEVLDAAKLDILEVLGYVYEIWRISPDTNEYQVIVKGANDYRGDSRYIEKEIQIFNAKWFCRISPVRQWYEFPETWILMSIGLFISILIASIVQNNVSLHILQAGLERLAKLDPLTEIYNRRYFIELINKQTSSTGDDYVIIFDLDHFKEINDSYGHAGGDQVLLAVTRTVQQTLRSSDIFARYGGEEFIIFVPSIDEQLVIKLAERIRLCICQKPVAYEDTSIPVTASFGIARLNAECTLNDAIYNADIALYKAKEDGRNRVVSYTASI